MAKIIKMGIYGLVFGLFASLGIIGGINLINAWSGNDSLTATSGETLTAEKWNTLVAKTSGIKSIQYGIAGNGTAGNAGGSSNSNISFDKPFSKIPIIIITPDETIDNSGPIGCRVQTKSTTGFSFKCWNGSGVVSVDHMNWVAFEPY
ncbi:MAG: H-type lectin domain-containing protein [Candidatus Absconditabacteria bacterium]